MKPSLALLALVCVPSALAQDVSPPGTIFSASAFDARRGRLVLFGGVVSMTNEEVSGDVWEFDGQRWARLTPAGGPPGRAWHAMTFDQARGRVVMFGGITPNGQQVLADTWEWDGATWTRGPDGPPGRGGHQLVYLATRGGIVLMGGMGSIMAGSALTDEWLYDGRTWRQLRGPSPAEAAAAQQSGMVDSRARAYSAAMRSDLRNLVTAQESFFADNVRYSGSLDSLRYRASNGITVRFVKVERNAWSAIATHQSVPDARCGIFVGSVAPPFAEVRNEGEPACVGLPAR